MSITAALYSAEQSGESIAALRSHASDLLSISVVPMRKPHFITDDYGLEAHVLVHFAVNKEHLTQSRIALALAIREFFSASEREVLVLYLDVPVIRRAGDARQVAPGYEQFVPEVVGWLVSPIEVAGE
jgi:hypothetical protein